MSVVWSKDFTVPPDDRDGVCGVKFEDRGQAAIMYSPVASMYQPEGATLYDPAFFVRLHSWEEIKPHNHTLFRSLMGRRVRVTIETIDDPTEAVFESRYDENDNPKPGW